MKNLQKGFIIPVLLAVIAVLVVGGGVYVYKNKKVDAPSVDTGVPQSNQDQQQTNNQNPSVNTQANNSNWKTYTNTKYGFSVGYPTTTKIKDTSVGVILTDGEKEFIVNVTKGLPADEFPCGFESGSLAKGNISLDGTIFTSFDSSKQTQDYSGGNVGVTQYCAFHKGDKYELFTQIHYPSTAEYVKDSSLVNKDVLLNEILYTFKFTK